ncbi:MULTISPECIES: serine/threonine-protein kinase [unclassified Massilia]|uniref:serine/threonine-protein kinase n=1 Tax=unclassified Massilia TaxID=2609279 RepID=UPI001784FCC9|nr:MULTISPECIES: serine/threonine-protein kinase [unclassified Massilia]MBD8528356.1 protein kinase [Massilia sp. CFBP 13647]MBD8672022.1 protein kinase [Massilia sp. CFBP 13721]
MSHPPDDDRTMLSSGAMPGPATGLAQGGEHALPKGTRLSEFEITGVLGEGGFGIVYCAHDTSLERQVALKEYMPSFAWRSTQAHVSVKSNENADSFEAGLRSFINEARMLAQFDHPSLVKVYRFWEANGTAYMVMPYYRGPTLKQVLRERPTPPDEAWLKALLAPLLDALDVIHQQHCYHRDIAPDNILMLDEGRPLLLDFGAARRAISGMNQAFTVILKQNYAPIEQYAEMPGMSQGAWTDLYALASVVHFAIAGTAPPQAVSRMLSDPYVPLASRFADRYSPAFLAAIDRALAFRPEHRPQSVGAMRTLLGLDPAAAAAARATAATSATAGAPVAPAAASAAATQAARPPAAQAEEGGTPGRTPGRTVLVAGAAAVALAGAGLFAWMNRDSAAPAEQSSAPSSAPAIDAPVARAPAVAAPPAAPAYNPVAALDAILAAASPERKVTVRVDSARVQIGHRGASFSIRSSHAGYVYLYMVGTAGDFQLLFPNAIDKLNVINPGGVLNLPRSRWKFDAAGPAGVDHFLVMVSESPRDFRSAGLETSELFSDFPAARAATLQREYTGATPLFAGIPSCSRPLCPGAYGAAGFTVEEYE